MPFVHGKRSISRLKSNAFFARSKSAASASSGANRKNLVRQATRIGPGSSGHRGHVTELPMAMATWNAGLSDEISDLKLASLLHDSGF